MDRHFVERIMLAVTEVNGCPACSYAHTQMALRAGMSDEEIRSFLNGDGRFVKPEEAKAILFAQHFAESRGRPSTDVWKAIVDVYGLEKSRVVLSASQAMLAGNIYGIPWSAFASRLSGKPYRDSLLGYELGMILSGLIFPIPVILHALFLWVFRKPNLRLSDAS